jgi:hypothetical protein
VYWKGIKETHFLSACFTTRQALSWMFSTWHRTATFWTTVICQAPFQALGGISFSPIKDSVK